MNNCPEIFKLKMLMEHFWLLISEGQTPTYQKFRKGVGGQRGLAQGNRSHARDSDLFSVPLFLPSYKKFMQN